MKSYNTKTFHLDIVIKYTVSDRSHPFKRTENHLMEYESMKATDNLVASVLMKKGTKDFKIVGTKQELLDFAITIAQVAINI